MKRIIYLVTFLFLSAGAFAQLPQLISYQAVVRNGNNALVTNTQVGVYVSIVKDSANGTVVYGELQTPTTNANGLFSVAVGTGLFATGKFSAIDWSSGIYFIKSQIDLTGGLNFTITGASQILSVPYALYAANGTQPGKNVGDMQYWDGTKWVIIPAGSNGSVLTMSNGKPTWGNAVSAPTVTTATPSSITSSTAVFGGNVTGDGGATVTSYGICYSTTSNPTTANSTVAVGSGTGSFSTTVTGLSASTTYYVRAYATNSAGTSYGSQVVITTLNVTLPPTVTTATPGSITSSTAVFGGNVTADGGATVTSYGICYSTTSNPTTANSIVAVGSGTGSFSTTVTGLNASTTYYVRAYAINSVGTSYGSQVVITTLNQIFQPTVTTNSPSSVTSTSAVFGGNLTSDGGASVTSYGFCYSTTSSPTITNSTVAQGSGTGSFSATVYGLNPGTTYYIRAYATNSVGTSYGSQVVITTLNVTLPPTVTTATPGSITSSTAVFGGNVTGDGNATVTSYGICYSTTSNPTTSNSTVAVGSGTGSFSTSVTGLNASTTYYVRAYATNSVGTSYGNQVVITTLAAASLPTVTTSVPNSITSSSALFGGNVTSDGGASVTSYGICYSTTTITPTTANSTVAVGAGTGSFSTTVYGLSPSTTYYIRAYATNSIGTTYGSLVAITTLAAQTLNPPTVTTTAPASLGITSSDIALGGNITNVGSSSVTSYGICYSTSSNPTTSNSTVLGVGSGNGVFLDTITGLNSSTTYYVRAFATNSAGTSYGNQLTITTEAFDATGLPTVKIVSFTPAANGTSGTAVAVVTYNGGSFVNNGLGFSWSTNSNPRFNPIGSIGSNFINNNSDTFTANITGLTAGTTYYLQADASNGWQSDGWSSVLSFTTSGSTTTYKIGQSYGGGTIFYVDATGQHGLIAANSDAGGMTQWDKPTGGTFATTNTTDTSYGAGAANTATIISTIGASGSYAALIASQTANGYSDWYLPSKGELDLMFINLWTKSLGNFTANVYWSSTEYNTNQAWAQSFSANTYINCYSYWKSNSAYIRPVRKF